MESIQQVKIATPKQALLVLVLILATLLIGFVGLNTDGIIMLTVVSLIAGTFAKYLGYNWNDIAEAISYKVSKSVPALLILLGIGVLTGTWMAGGVIPAMIYYGLIIIDPNFLLVTAFIVGSLISLVTGTSWGTVGTIGVAMIGVATGLGIPLPMIAGAVISGAYFGDKMSPLSDTTNMASLAAKADLYDHIKQMFVTTIPAMIFACIVFGVLGSNFSGDLVNSPIYNSMINELETNFHFNLVLLIPPAIVLYGAVTKKPTVPTLLASSAVAVIIAYTIQGFDLAVSINSIKSGFSSSVALQNISISPEVAKLLNRGGGASMFEAVIFVIVAFAFGGIIQLTQVIEIALKKMLSSIKNVTQLVLASGLSSSVTIAIVQNSYITYFLVSETYGAKYKELGLKERNLSRVLEDFVTVVEGLMPWTVSGVYMATTLGVSCLDFAPYAVFNWACVALSIIYAFTYKSIGKFAFSLAKDGAKTESESSPVIDSKG
ncbi:Na+/H+ antiporter NhaC [Vibrio sp.]|uniref:Na+/H+ antiporter NhaC n=1 Tax=Vibrio sp. TaxID=678 RepID=UPI0029C816DD|nr:Na+/H+ antiporter NhaC [uncultured Vibrio sp.]